MKQILQSLKTGLTEVADVPVPDLIDGHLLIVSSKTLLSVGTERMLLRFGKANLLEKARLQPDKRDIDMNEKPIYSESDCCSRLRVISARAASSSQTACSDPH